MIRKNLFSTNDADPKPGHGTIVAHADTQATRLETLEGIGYTVVPVAVVKEKVLNGAFVSGREISAHVDSWNGIPVPVYHPEVEGMNVSANDPHLIATQSIGQFFYAKFDHETNTLRGELWLNTEKAKSLGGEALQALEMATSGGELEVSSAFFADRLDRQGTFEGEDFYGEWLNLRPDHIAVLPNGVGACSWADGCGVRANSRAGDTKQILLEGFVALTGITVDPDTEKPMKEKLISALIAHANSAFTEANREFLESLDEEQLAAHAKQAGCSCHDDNSDAGEGEGESSSDAGEGEGDTNDGGEGEGEGGEPQTLEAALAAMPDSPAREALKGIIATHAATRAARIETLSKVEACKLSKDQLADLTDDALAALASSFGASDDGSPDSYAGRQFPGRAPATHGKDGETRTTSAPPAVFRNKELFAPAKTA